MSVSDSNRLEVVYIVGTTHWKTGKRHAATIELEGGSVWSSQRARGPRPFSARSRLLQPSGGATGTSREKKPSGTESRISFDCRISRESVQGKDLRESGLESLL